MLRLSKLGVLVTAIVFGSLATASTATGTPFGPPVPAVAPGCATHGADSRADAAFGGGLVRGFASFGGSACRNAIYFFQGGSQGYTQLSTPYHGILLSVAADNAATYLLYETLNAHGGPAAIAITKRDHQGHFFPSRVLSTAVSHQVATPTADVAAYHGRWWAVWTEQVGPGGEFAHTQLFQAKTAGTPQSHAAVTTSASNVTDNQPSIALDGNGAVLAWTRQTSPAADGPSRVWVGVERDTVLARARALINLGIHNNSPDIQRLAGVTYLTWTRDGKVVESDNGTGGFRSHQFLVPGHAPRISASQGTTFVAWMTSGGSPATQKVLFARGNKGSNSFEGQYLTSGGPVLQALVGVHGVATALIRTGTQVDSTSSQGLA